MANDSFNLLVSSFVSFSINGLKENAENLNSQFWDQLLEAMFTTTEENEVALSLFCDFGIFSQDQFCL